MLLIRAKNDDERGRLLRTLPADRLLAKDEYINGFLNRGVMDHVTIAEHKRITQAVGFEVHHPNLVATSLRRSDQPDRAGDHVFNVVSDSYDTYSLRHFNGGLHVADHQFGIVFRQTEDDALTVESLEASPLFVATARSERGEDLLQSALHNPLRPHEIHIPWRDPMTPDMDAIWRLNSEGHIFMLVAPERITNPRVFHETAEAMCYGVVVRRPCDGYGQLDPLMRRGDRMRVSLDMRSLNDDVYKFAKTVAALGDDVTLHAVGPVWENPATCQAFWVMHRLKSSDEELALITPSGGPQFETYRFRT